MQPVENLQPLDLRDAVEALVPRGEHFDAAGWTIRPALTRAFQPIAPRRANAADEIDPGIGARWQVDRQFARPDLVEADHGDQLSKPTITSDALIMAYAVWPALSPSSSTASLVIEAGTMVPPTPSRTWAVVAPFLASRPLPSGRF